MDLLFSRYFFTGNIFFSFPLAAQPILNFLSLWFLANTGLISYPYLEVIKVFVRVPKLTRSPVAHSRTCILLGDRMINVSAGSRNINLVPSETCLFLAIDFNIRTFLVALSPCFSVKPLESIRFCMMKYNESDLW